MEASLCVHMHVCVLLSESTEQEATATHQEQRSSQHVSSKEKGGEGSTCTYTCIYTIIHNTSSIYSSIFTYMKLYNYT